MAVEPGGISDITVLKFLILYVLHYCEHPVCFGTLSDILLGDGLVDFFDYSTALEQMEQSGHVCKTEQDGEAYFTYTELGYEAVSLFQRRIPTLVRERSIQSARKILSRERTAMDISAQYTLQEDGTCVVRLSAAEQQQPLIAVTLPTINEHQARAICDNFRANASRILPELITSITRGC